MPTLLGNKSPRLAFGQRGHLSISSLLRLRRVSPMRCPSSLFFPVTSQLIIALAVAMELLFCGVQLCLVKWELGWAFVPISSLRLSTLCLQG